MKKWLLLTVLLVFGLAGCSESAKIPVEFDETSIEADDQGKYEVSGVQEIDAVIKFDGREMDLKPDKDGNFITTITPAEPADEVFVTAQYQEDDPLEITLTIDNAKYEKKLAAEQQEKQAQKKKIEQEKQDALKKAEQAAELKIKEAEKELSSDKLKEAQALVLKIPGGNKDFSERLIALKKAIADNEQLAQEAETKVRAAEKDLTNDALKEAQASIENMAGDTTSYTDRLAKVEEKIIENDRLAKEKAEKEQKEKLAAQEAEKERLAAEKVEQERIAEEQAAAAKLAEEQAEAQRIAAEKAEQERLAAEQAEAQRLAEEQAAAPVVEEQVEDQHVHPEGEVYVTRTGSKYHAYAHGNGDFWLDTLSNAEARGLTPCQVCW